jgi:hypothetical protein
MQYEKRLLKKSFIVLMLGSGDWIAGFALYTLGFLEAGFCESSLQRTRDLRPASHGWSRIQIHLGYIKRPIQR